MKFHQLINAGKITLASGIFGILIIAGVAMIGGYSARVGAQSAANTAVKVLNTPPLFNGGSTTTFPGYASEAIVSATATPWLNGNSYAFTASAHDTSGDHIWLLVCGSSSTAPTANTGAAPVCGAGMGDQIAVSSSFFNGANSYDAVQVYATTTLSTMSESMAWYAYVCDDVPGNPRCSIANQGQSGNNNASPFAITHPLTFSNLLAYANFTPNNAQVITSSSTQIQKVDTNNGPVTATLHLCKSAVSDITSAGCGTGNFYASSTVAAATNPDASVVFSAPAPAGSYALFPYVIDKYGYQANGAGQGSSLNFTVSNVAPTVDNVSIASSTLYLNTPAGLSTSTAYAVTFQATDMNGCLNMSSGNEFATTSFQFYRTSVTCSAAGDHNDYSCYNNASSSAWSASTTCSQDAVCGGGAVSANWTCRFPLWYTTDPTDAGAKFVGDNWKSRIAMTDSGAITGAATTSATTNIVAQLSYIDLSSNSLNFGEWQPGTGNANLGIDHLGGNTAVLGVVSKGNTSLDMNLKSSHMCPTYSSSTPCTGNESNNTIFANRQHFATSSIAYASGYVSSSTVDIPLALQVPKNNIPGTYNNKDVYWGIFVPGTLTTSGDYKGLNTLTMVLNANTSTW